jgi:hypothetical protein
MSPHEFRIGIGPDKPALLAYKPDGSDRCQTSVLLPESNKENFALIFRSLDSLLTKLDIMNLPQHEPEKYFLTGAARAEPAIYVRFVRGNQTWQSRFSTNEIPPKIRELYAGCWSTNNDGRIYLCLHKFRFYLGINQRAHQQQLGSGCLIRRRNKTVGCEHCPC